MRRNGRSSCKMRWWTTGEELALFFPVDNLIHNAPCVQLAFAVRIIQQLPPTQALPVAARAATRGPLSVDTGSPAPIHTAWLSNRERLSSVRSNGTEVLQFAIANAQGEGVGGVPLLSLAAPWRVRTSTPSWSAPRRSTGGTSSPPPVSSRLTEWASDSEIIPLSRRPTPHLPLRACPSAVDDVAVRSAAQFLGHALQKGQLALDTAFPFISPRES